MTIEANITQTVIDAFDENVPRKRAVLRVQGTGAMSAVTGAAAVTVVDHECWVLLKSAGRREHADLSVENRTRPWLVSGLDVRPMAGHLLLVEGEPGSHTFSHESATRTGGRFAVVGEPVDRSAGVGALWDLVA